MNLKVNLKEAHYISNDKRILATFWLQKSQATPNIKTQKLN